MDADPGGLLRFGIIVGALAVIVWAILLVEVARREIKHRERRPLIFAMPVVGLVAAVGSLASAIGGSALLEGWDIDVVSLAVIASMGRGALLMGGIVALIYLTHPYED